MKTSMEGHTKLFFCFSLSSFLIMSTATDTITMSQSIREGETIVSDGGCFALGFFSPGNSTKRYLGIWYNLITSSMTVVWVANKETPLVDSSGVLKVTSQGILVLLNHNETIIWSSNSSRSVLNPVAQLLDSGNFVVRDGNDQNLENSLWQSFDYPCDTLLPGMKLGRNTITGKEWYLTSWTSNDDPSPGDVTYRLDPRGYPELIMRKGSVGLFRSGPWNGLRFSGLPNFSPNPIYKLIFVINQKEMYYTNDLVNSSVLSRMMLNQNGIIQRFIWTGGTDEWNLYRRTPKDDCDGYALCGAYASCKIDNSFQCGCLKGFVPKFPKEWDIAEWSNGCVRRTPLDCQSGDGFIKYSNVKLPETRYSWFNDGLTLEECKVVCLKNCSCTAYGNLDMRDGGSGCLLWFGDLIDIREFAENGQDIYTRVASSEVGQVGSNWKKRGRIIVYLMSAGMLLLALGLILYIWKKKQLSRQGKNGDNLGSGQKEDLELPLFDFATVADATNNFLIDNKLGEGGFGPVYKGVLEDGQEIAVKRLSQNSKQGLDEFMNEVWCIAKLQHRNLVKLLGCCIQKEKMLIYEYMTNKSLDFFIFDQTRSLLLNWCKRFQITSGIARGLLYLHQDSRLRIIHRDLKASNILLDYEMNPKISDFGMARSFKENETEANTTRVVGTYGYMSPEYAIDGIFSVKSDVFSFGVLVLEIVSGKRNRGFHHPDHNLNLLGHAWKLYREGRSLELIGEFVWESCDVTEVLRSIHVGLLCVQRCPEDRPSMASVVHMLGGESALPQSKQPGFFTERNPLEEDQSQSSRHELCSANEISITLLAAR